MKKKIRKEAGQAAEQREKFSKDTVAAALKPVAILKGMKMNYFFSDIGRLVANIGVDVLCHNAIIIPPRMGEQPTHVEDRMSAVIWGWHGWEGISRSWIV